MNNDKDNTVKKTLLITAFLLAGCVERPQVISDCQGVAEREVLCGWQKPEDMELLPDGRHLVVSQMAAGHGSVAGSLALLDTRDGSKQVWPMAEVAVSDGWGDADCAAPDPSIFAPHGIHLSRHESGTLQLLVVNHGGRESVEFFELRDQDGAVKPFWRGCVIPPEGSFLNDIVALPEGGFMATHMYTRGDAPVGTLGWQEITALAGFNPGHIWVWDGEQFSKLPGFSGDYPNGIQISADGETLFVNLWAGSTLQKLDRRTGKLLGEVEISHPDNSQWDGRGKLLIASHNFTLGDFIVCPSIEEGACPAAFDIVELDPDTLQSRVVVSVSGPPMGAGTVAQRVDDAVYVGSFIGDRILRLPYSAQ